MKDLIIQTFTDYRTPIIFLHIISAVVWVGGMIAMRFAAHHSIQSIHNTQIKLERTTHALKRLFSIVAPFVAILIITAVLMAVGYGFRAAAIDANGNVTDAYAMHLYNLVHVKESIWLLMTVNFIAMVLRRNKAEKLIAQGDFSAAAKALMLIGRYMVPLNIILGICAIYLGVTLRNG
jgi:uncharacterized membrane protein